MNTDTDTPPVDSDDDRPAAELAARPPRAARPRRVKAATEEVATPSAPAAADVQVSGDTAPEVTARPARRPRRPKSEAGAGEGAPAAADVSVAPASADASPPDAPPAAVEAATPARRPRKPRAAAGEAVAAAATAEPTTGDVAQDAPARAEAVPAVPPAAAPEGGPAQAGAPVAAGDRGHAADDPACDAGDQAEGGDDTDGAESTGQPGGEDSARRRRRNRRRRGGRGGEAAAGAEGGSGEGGEGGEPPGPPPIPLVELSTQGDPTEMFAKVVSGQFDIEPEGEAGRLPPKRVLPPEPDSPKLHKVLAQAGVGSRRDMEELIADGRITVNGQPAHTGQRISYGDEIRVAGRVIKVRIQPPLARVIAYHKPAGEVVTHDDPQNRPTVFRRLPRLAQGKWQSVGRLDINTEGLLLFTNSGDLANKLMHPRFGVEREYAVRVLGTLDEDTREQLLEGVPVDGQDASFKSIEDGGGEGANHWYRVVITEGRNREVRKLFDAVGLTVSRLIRIRYGCVVLPRGLRRGVWIDLENADVQALKRLAGADTAVPAANSPARGGEPARGEAGRGDAQRARQRDRGNRNERRGSRRPEDGGVGTIPNPLQQTYDRRPPPRERDFGQNDEVEEEDIGPIPNPLQQTYDRRFVQKPRGIGGQGKGGGNTPRQPDPMQTSVGYIGADTFMRRNQRGGGGGGGGRRKR